MRSICFATLLILGMSGVAHANDAVSYSYDAKGRLTKVVHSGSVNTGTVVTYTHDHADNRVRVQVIGAP